MSISKYIVRPKEFTGKIIDRIGNKPYLETLHVNYKNYPLYIYHLNNLAIYPNLKHLKIDCGEFYDAIINPQPQIQNLKTLEITLNECTSPFIKELNKDHVFLSHLYNPKIIHFTLINTRKKPLYINGAHINYRNAYIENCHIYNRYALRGKLIIKNCDIIL